jgi:N4-gp56 family major capsid protein
MSTSIIGVNDAKAVKRYSATLFADSAREGYFGSRFAGKGENTMAPIQVLLDLAKDAGDTISYDLSMQLSNQPTFGDERLAGKMAALKWATDTVHIDQIRCGVSAGGRMSRKRVLHDLRMVARARMSEWWGRWDDEETAMYLSGARGINEGFIASVDFAGYAGNAFTAPDDEHQMYGGAATSKASLTSGDKMSLSVIDKAVTKAKTMGGRGQKVPQIRPMRFDGEDRFVLLMSEFDAYNLRTSTSVGQWLDIQKAIAASVGNKSPIVTGALGMYNNVVLHSHDVVIRFNDYGAGSNVAASRCLFMGRQAANRAHGNAGNGLRYDWHEEQVDHGNEIEISTSTIRGTKKNSFEIAGTRRDFGLLSIDCAAADPN